MAAVKCVCARGVARRRPRSTSMFCSGFGHGRRAGRAVHRRRRRRVQPANAAAAVQQQMAPPGLVGSPWQRSPPHYRWDVAPATGAQKSGQNQWPTFVNQLSHLILYDFLPPPHTHTRPLAPLPTPYPRPTVTYSVRCVLFFFFSFLFTPLDTRHVYRAYFHASRPGCRGVFFSIFPKKSVPLFAGRNEKIRDHSISKTVHEKWSEIGETGFWCLFEFCNTRRFFAIRSVATCARCYSRCRTPF